MPSWRRGGNDSPEPERSQRQLRPRLRTRKGQLLADLQARLDDALAQLSTQEKITAELAHTLARHQSSYSDLERRLATLEGSYQTTLDELRADRERHQRHLTQLQASVERHKRAMSALEHTLGGAGQ
jgi:chromosome segregation ATPase